MSMGNAMTAAGGIPAGPLNVRVTDEQLSLSPDRPFVLGRASACDLVVNDARVSRRHLMLEPSPEGWTAIDLSANGTWLAGERIHRMRIRGECRLRLGAADGPEVTISPVEPPDTRPSDPAPMTVPLQAAGGHWAQPTYLARGDEAPGPMLPDDHPTPTTRHLPPTSPRPTSFGSDDCRSAGRCPTTSSSGT
jgi:hypothetical protein